MRTSAKGGGLIKCGHLRAGEEGSRKRDLFADVLYGRPLVVRKPAASIRFEICGSWIRVKKIDFSGEISKKFRFFFRQFHQKIDFSRQISEKFRLLKQFKNLFVFPGKNCTVMMTTKTTTTMIMIIIDDPIRYYRS